MQRPKHIRQASKAKLEETVNNNQALKAQGLLGTSKGYRLSPDMRHGYVFTNPSNLGRTGRFGMDGTNPNAKHSPLPQGTGSWRK